MPVSLNFRQQAYAQETGIVVICLMTITHPDIEVPIRISTDPTQRLSANDTEVIYGTISRSNEYYFYPMALKLPDETEDGPQNMTIEIDNVHRDLIATIRSITGPPLITTEMVLSNDLDTVEASWPDFMMTKISYDAMQISATLVMELLEREPFPAGSFTPTHFPGLF